MYCGGDCGGDDSYMCGFSPMDVCVAGDCEIEPPGLVCADDRVVCEFSSGGVFVAGGCGMLTPGMMVVRMAASCDACLRACVRVYGLCVRSACVRSVCGVWVHGVWCVSASCACVPARG